MSIVRWALILPAALAGALLAPILVSLATEWILRGYIVEVLKTLTGSILAVYWGAVTAPKYRPVVAGVIFTLYVLGSGFVLAYVVGGVTTQQPEWLAFHLFLGVIAAGSTFGWIVYVEARPEQAQAIRERFPVARFIRRPRLTFNPTRHLARFGAFGGGLLVAVFFLVGGFATLAGGYWLSDRAYDAGLWPIGAIMRIALLGGLLGWAFFLLAILISSIASLFSKDEL